MNDRRITKGLGRRGLILGAVALFFMATLAAPAAASSTYSVTIACKGNGWGYIELTWAINGTSVQTDSGGCYGNDYGSFSGIARPDGVNGFWVTVYAEGCLTTTSKSAQASFDVDGSFSQYLKVSNNENSRDPYYGCGHVRETVEFTVSG